MYARGARSVDQGNIGLVDLPLLFVLTQPVMLSNSFAPLEGGFKRIL